VNIENIRTLILTVKDKLKNETDHHDWFRTKLAPKVSNIRNSPTGSGYTTGMENVSYIDISGVSFIIDEIKKTDIFKQVVKDLVENHPLAKDHQNPVTQTEFWIETFLKNLIRLQLENKLDDTKEMEIIMTLKDEFDKLPIPIEIIEFLNGAYIEDKNIKISKSLEIRQPLASDLENALERSSVFDGHLHVPSIVSNLTTKEQENRLSHDREHLSLILRLFRLGSVFSERGLYDKSSVIWPGKQTSGYSLPGRYNVHHKYEIKSSESNDLILFYSVIKEKLNLLSKDTKKSSIQMALSNFGYSLLEPIEPERRLFSAIIGLEALFTQSGEFGETSFRLALRIGKLMGLIGFKSQDIKNFMEKCYKIRNKVGHGQLLDDKIRNESQEYVAQILNYLRISIVLFLLCLDDKSKGELINSLDKAMVDEHFNSEFKEWLQSKTKELPNSVLL
jgi:hypothetical protein